jgi:hypothetical protein
LFTATDGDHVRRPTRAICRPFKLCDVHMSTSGLKRQNGKGEVVREGECQLPGLLTCSGVHWQSTGRFSRVVGLIWTSAIDLGVQALALVVSPAPLTYNNVQSGRLAASLSHLYHPHSFYRESTAHIAHLPPNHFNRSIVSCRSTELAHLPT